MPRPKSSAPNLHWREVAGGFLGRWEVGPKRRAQGFRGVDLWADGAPFTADDWRAIGFAHPVAALTHKGRTPMNPREAAKAVRALNEAAADQAEAARAARPAPAPRAYAAPRIADMIAAYLAAARASVAAKTFVNYETYARVFAETFGAFEPADVSAEKLKAWHERLIAARGPHAAHKAATMATRIFKWAARKDAWATRLPPREAYTELHLAGPKARLRVGTPAEMAALALAFDDPAAIYTETGAPAADRALTPRPEMADALVLMLWTAARVEDALSLAEARFTATRLAYQQAKTGRHVDIPLLPPLAARLPAMRARRMAALRRHDTAADALILNAQTGRPFVQVSAKTGVSHHARFNEIWREHRALAAKIAPTLGGDGEDRHGRPASPFNPQDCRDTACSRLVAAGATLEQVSSWHGSEPAHVLQLVRHYIEITGQTADEGGERLAAMAKAQGIAV